MNSIFDDCRKALESVGPRPRERILERAERDKNLDFADFIRLCQLAQEPTQEGAMAERTITVRLTENQAAEASLACINQRDRLDKDRQHMITSLQPAFMIDMVGKRIANLRRVETILMEAMQDGRES